MKSLLRLSKVILAAGIAVAISGCGGSDSVFKSVPKAPAAPVLQSVGGTITGLTGTVVLQNNGGDAQSIGTDGPFTLSTPVAQSSAYVVTVKTQPSGQTCTVSNGSGTVGTANITNVTVVCSASTFTIGGTVSGVSGSVVLANNGGDAETLSSDGSFTFPTPLAAGSPYAVTVQTQPADQTCSVSNASGTTASANVTNVSVVCSTNTYSVGGTVSGLSGTVVMQDNGADPIPVGTDGPFTFDTQIAEGSAYAVTVQTQPNGQTCTVSNGSGTMAGASVSNVSVTCVAANTTLSVSATGVIPVNGATGTLTVTNTGSTYAAYNVSATLPGGWVGVIQDASDCLVVTPGSSCTLSFTSSAPYVAQGNITVSGLNITSPPTTALAFSIDDYLVFAVPTASTAVVVAASDSSPGILWSVTYDVILGIDEASTSSSASPTSPAYAGGTPAALACNGSTDGSCNTANITSFYTYNSVPLSGYAAGLCQSITSDNSGAVSQGTWYLPAICQMGGPGALEYCASGMANIDTNLSQLGFAGLSVNPYWSSTEFSSFPSLSAWIQSLATSGNLFQNGVDRQNSAAVRCVREIGY